MALNEVKAVTRKRSEEVGRRRARRAIRVILRADGQTKLGARADGLAEATLVVDEYRQAIDRD